MADLPYFPFYPADWISSPRIMCLTLAQQGAYMRLLCACWMSGDCSLPEDHQKLSMISGLPVEEVKTLGPFLGPHPTKTGHITNERLMKEWDKAHWISDMRSQAGKKSGKSRRTCVQQKHKQSANKIPTNSDKSEVRSQTHNSESKDIIQKEEKMPLRANVVKDDFFLDLKKNPAYAHIDMERENGKMDAWLALPANQNRIKTRKFVLNWLNKIEAPLPGAKPQETALEKFLRR